MAPTVGKHIDINNMNYNMEFAAPKVQSAGRDGGASTGKSRTQRKKQKKKAKGRNAVILLNENSAEVTDEEAKTSLENMKKIKESPMAILKTNKRAPGEGLSGIMIPRSVKPNALKNTEQGF